jgi:hypothetical protein
MWIYVDDIQKNRGVRITLAMMEIRTRMRMQDEDEDVAGWR